ncbi:MAG: hypothetical protein NTV95_04360 [Candidatus Saccharibacteria bacterium]|nr:hypothetical protein [Candidatus Saccharibacteria bacterium]
MAKNTKQSKQKKSVLNKLGGLSKRSKFIVVVLIFAVLGGGYLTYKSFAATRYTEILTSAKDLSGAEGQCNVNKVNDASKSDALVMQIYCPQRTNYSTTDFSIVNRTGSPYTVPSGYFQACVMMKGVATFTVGVGGAGFNSYSINDSKYKEYCSKPYWVSDTSNLPLTRLYGQLKFVTKNPILMSVSYIATYRYPGTAVPAPTGGK